MIGTRWFKIGTPGRWHALDEEATPWTTRCGARTVSEPHMVASTAESLYPPNPCASCQLEVAMDDVEDEPIADAKARGYYAWEPEPSEG